MTLCNQALDLVETDFFFKQKATYLQRGVVFCLCVYGRLRLNNSCDLKKMPAVSITGTLALHEAL